LVVIVESASTLLLKARGGTAFTGRLFGSREEMRLFMQESGQSLSSEERLMINRVLDLQSMSVHQAMVPMAKVTAMDSTATVADALEMSRRLHFTRLPVWETRGNARRISGILSLNTLLYQPDLDPSRPVSAYVRPAIFIDEGLRLELALRRMQRAGERLAIVLSRDRREVGVLSLQDVMRVIFGEVSL
jgi:CBS domain containing-hemolysin-like protein